MCWSKCTYNCKYCMRTCIGNLPYIVGCYAKNLLEENLPSAALLLRRSQAEWETQKEPQREGFLICKKPKRRKIWNYIEYSRTILPCIYYIQTSLSAVESIRITIWLERQWRLRQTSHIVERASRAGWRLHSKIAFHWPFATYRKICIVTSCLDLGWLSREDDQGNEMNGR